MKILAVLLLAAVVSGDVIEYKSCRKSTDVKCTIHEIRVNPCNTPTCKFRTGSDAVIFFDFTPHFNAEKLTTKMVHGGVALVTADACGSTTCPTVSGQQQTYAYTLRFAKLHPSGKLTFEWHVVDQNNEDNKCCFKLSVDLYHKRTTKYYNLL